MPMPMGTPKKIRKKQTPETQFHSSLTLCSKHKDLPAAIALYESALSQNTRFNYHHFNTLLYLCSNSVSDSSLKQLASENGFRMFDHMLSIGILPNEATITAVARLAAAKGDGDYAFGLVKGMEKYNIFPKLRSYDPALFCFCEKSEAEKAYEVEEHMGMVGVSLEEPEIVALLKVSAETGNGERVYGYLHKLRNVGRCVSESTVKNIEDWFCGGAACEVEKLQKPRGGDVGPCATESENGSWHVPIADESCQEPARTWLCITRPSVLKACGEVSQNLASSQNGVICDNHELLRSCTSEPVASHRDKTTFVTGKRKERSPSPSRINISPA
ncbi:hypothetical protein C1H46_023758 [Malus baccata]|uniref:PROP1-like PPR domain-containing protein n=1 Tax=Malus baccata TaxID=106549 RepID=A0A540LW23_MALBA|nr:hypothetical protein C1H46_023758 [Malus baccata]